MQAMPPRKRLSSLYSKEHLARLISVTKPEDFKALLCRGNECKFWRHAIWELVHWFYASADPIPIPQNFLTNELVLLPFIDYGELAPADEPKLQWLQASCFFFYTAFMTLVRTVVDWHERARRGADKKLAITMPDSELPRHLLQDFQSAVVCRSTWLEVVQRVDAGERCVWYEYVMQYIPQLYERRRQGLVDPLRLLEMCLDVVHFLLNHRLSDADIHELWEISRAAEPSA